LFKNDSETQRYKLADTYGNQIAGVQLILSLVIETWHKDEDSLLELKEYEQIARHKDHEPKEKG